MITKGDAFSNRDFVFVAFRGLLSTLGARSADDSTFVPVLIALFGVPLFGFLLIDGILVASFQTPHLFFVLVFMAAAYFSNLFLLYDEIHRHAPIGIRLRQTIRPTNTLIFHVVMMLIAVGLQIHNYRTAAVDITQGSLRLSSWAGITTSVTGWYKVFGASVLAYVGLVLIVKFVFIVRRFNQIFNPIRQLSTADSLDSLRALLTLNLVLFRGLLFFSLYLLSWKTKGFTSTVPVNKHFEVNLFLLLLLCTLGATFTERSRRLVITSYQNAIDRALASVGAPHPLWIARKAVASTVTSRYVSLYAVLLYLILTLVVAYARPSAIDVVLSFSNPVLAFFGLTILPLLDLRGLSTSYHRFTNRLVDDLRKLTSTPGFRRGP